MVLYYASITTRYDNFELQACRAKRYCKHNEYSLKMLGKKGEIVGKHKIFLRRDARSSSLATGTKRLWWEQCEEGPEKRLYGVRWNGNLYLQVNFKEKFKPLTKIAVFLARMYHRTWYKNWRKVSEVNFTMVSKSVQFQSIASWWHDLLFTSCFRIQELAIVSSWGSFFWKFLKASEPWYLTSEWRCLEYRLQYWCIEGMS